MSQNVTISGHCAEKFEAVQEAFRANFDEGREIGAAIALYLDGELAIDLWSGFRDAEKTSPWQEDTLVNVWSTTKGVTAGCFALLVDRGMCSYDDKVADYWPEFAAGGKGEVTIAQLLSHQAGLSAFAEPTSLDDFVDGRRLAGALAAQTPLWEPGSQSGYHAVTIGFLAAELFRRITGASLTSFVEREMKPFDLHIGIANSELGRVANIVPPAGMNAEGVVPDLNALQAATLGNPQLEPDAANTAGWRQSEIPSANGFANARGLAGLYSSIVGGAPVAGLKLSEETLQQATCVRMSGPDAVLTIDANWAAGFLRNSLNIYGPHEGAFGHSGWGGSFAFADPESGLAFSYVMNAMGTDLVGDPRTLRLLEALYQSL